MFLILSGLPPNLAGMLQLQLNIFYASVFCHMAMLHPRPRYSHFLLQDISFRWVTQQSIVALETPQMLNLLEPLSTTVCKGKFGFFLSPLTKYKSVEIRFGVFLCFNWKLRVVK